VQAEAARALGTMRSGIALDAILGCVAVRNPKARRAVMGALGQFRDERAAAALIAVLRKGDASYYVEMNAAHALGQTRSAKAFDTLAKVAMKKESQNDVIRTGALQGLAELKDERALSIALEWTTRGKSNPVRGTATLALGRIGQLSDRAKDAAYDLLVELLQDEWLRVRINACNALADLKDAKAIAELSRAVDRDLDGRVIRTAREAMARLRDGASKSEEVKKLRADLDKMIEDNRKMTDRLDKLEASSGGAKAARRPAKRPTAKRPRQMKRAAANRSR
jgi:aminopeptidase N